MADDVLTLQGSKELSVDFTNIRKGMNTAALRAAARAGGKIIQKKAEQNAPVGSNRRPIRFKDGSRKKRLSKAIRVVNQKNPRGKTGEVKVDVGWLPTAFHGAFIHSGAKEATYGPRNKAFKMPKARRGSGGKPFIRGLITIPRRGQDRFLTDAFRSEKTRAHKAVRKHIFDVQQKIVGKD